MVAFAVATMLGAPFALLHGGAAQRVATAAPTGHTRPTSLGRTQLIAAARPAGPSAAVLARHRSAVRHNEAVRRARAIWHAERVRAAEALAGEAAAGSSQSVAPPPPSVRRPSLPTPARVHTVSGIATWYAWHPGQCASPFLPHGTLLTVTDLATGKTIQCLVTDTEAHNPGRVVDLSNWCFEELAPLSQGVIEVRISW